MRASVLTPQHPPLDGGVGRAGHAVGGGGPAGASHASTTGAKCVSLETFKVSSASPKHATVAIVQRMFTIQPLAPSSRPYRSDA